MNPYPIVAVPASSVVGTLSIAFSIGPVSHLVQAVQFLSSVSHEHCTWRAEVKVNRYGRFETFNTQLSSKMNEVGCWTKDWRKEVDRSEAMGGKPPH